MARDEAGYTEKAGYRETTCYYVRLRDDDKRYWHWKLAKRDRLDVFHEGRWYVMVAWTDLLQEDRPTAEVALVLRGEARVSARGSSLPKTGSEPGSPTTISDPGRGHFY